VEKKWQNNAKWHANETLGHENETLDFLSETRPRPPLNFSRQSQDQDVETETTSLALCKWTAVRTDK